jgi:hypothetical protein
MSDSTKQAVYRITTTAGLRAIIPQLVGFTPVGSMVVIGTRPPGGEVVVTLRYDLPRPGEDDTPAGLAAHAEDVLTQAGITDAVAVGYGPDKLTRPVAEALRATSLSILVYAETGLPGEPPGDLPDSPVLPDRAALAASVAPVSGDWAQDMRETTRRGLARANENPAGFTQLGLATMQGLITRYRDADSGAVVTYDEAATVTVALRNLRVRDDAWARLDPAHKAAHLRLLTDLARLAAPGYVAAPASLLAFAAWQSGNGALANVALDRAEADDPYYSMALMLRQAINNGAPPSLARLPMTPAEVAASYDEMEGDRA